MIIIVTGHPRSGTTMMMKCLQAGGIQLVVDETKGKLKNRLEPPSIFSEKLLEDPFLHEGKAIKLVFPHLLLPLRAYKSGYTIIVMRRDPYEINASYLKELGGVIRLGKYYDDELDRIEATLDQRQDITLHSFQYREFLEHSESMLSSLEISNFDVKEACNIVDPSLCHEKREELKIEGPWNPR